MSTTYTFVKNPGEKEKLAPQARIILGHIEAAGKAGIERKALCELLDADVKAGKLETRQETSKLVGFYQKPMEEAGLINIERVKAEPKPKAEPKAKGEKKTVAKAKDAVPA